MKGRTSYRPLLEGWPEPTHSPSERGAVGFLLLFAGIVRGMMNCLARETLFAPLKTGGGAC